MSPCPSSGIVLTPRGEGAFETAPVAGDSIRPEDSISIVGELTAAALKTTTNLFFGPRAVKHVAQSQLSHILWQKQHNQQADP